jgi:hypothetical protein
MQMQSLVSAVVLALALSACATDYNPRYRLAEIVVNNNTRDAVQDVTIRAGDRVFSCGNIAPLGMCSNRLAGYVRQVNVIDVEWTLGNDAQRRESLEARVPATFSVGRPLMGVLDIEPQGVIEASFRQFAAFP